ncbi:MAG: hypothetical protein KGH84_05670 [Paracoccaceae bacterium]|nr:hypothetical protein [Paracoccaceae bacterium]
MRRARNYPHETVEIRCTRCERHGRYSKARFCELVGAATLLPSALGKIAMDCPRANLPSHVLHDRCGARYEGL